MKKSLIIIVVLIILIILSLGVYFLLKGTPLDFKTDQDWPKYTSSYDIQGMKVEILQQGNGPETKNGDKVTVNYVGTLENGTKFDSSIDRNQPFEFILGQNAVIQGWELGVLGMKVGEKRKLTIPPELGYGSQAIGEIIPANSTLVFEIDLLGINQ